MSANLGDTATSAMNGKTEGAAPPLGIRDLGSAVESANASRDRVPSPARDRGAKSSSPLSQFEFDEGTRDPGPNNDSMDIDSDMEMDDEEDNQDEADDLVRQADQTDRISDATVQPQRSPGQDSNQDSGGVLAHGTQNEAEDDDDADERQSSVTSSTIPLTSLDDSPNHRNRGANATTATLHSAVPKTLGVSAFSITATLSDPKESTIAESGTLSSITEATKPSHGGGETSRHSRDDDGSDLTSDDDDLDISDDDDEGRDEVIDEVDDEDDDGFTDVFSETDEEQVVDKGQEDSHFL